VTLALQKNESGLALSRQRALKMFLKQLFQATLTLCLSELDTARFHSRIYKIQILGVNDAVKAAKELYQTRIESGMYWIFFGIRARTTKRSNRSTLLNVYFGEHCALGSLLEH